MHLKKSFFLLFTFIFVLLSGCGGGQASDSSQPPAPSQQQSVPPADQPGADPTPDATPEPTPEPTPAYDLYEFGVPLEESDPVEDDSFFDNTVFLGDSRTEGLQLFSGLTHGDFYWARGMSVFQADNDNYRLFEIDGQDYTLVGTLGCKQYDKVYLMLGVNELGYAADSYERGLGVLLDKIIAAQPDAVVYLQLLPPVNEAEAQSSGLGDYINNTNVDRFNEAIVRMAAEKHVVLLDVASVYRGDDGQLPAELSADGCHFTYGAYAIWADYLRNHTIDPERYFYNRSLVPAELPEGTVDEQ